MSDAPKQAPSTAGSGPAAQVSIDTFRKLDLRVGVITAAEEHPNADKLLVLTVDIGDGNSRRVVAGIKAYYQPAELIGKQVAVVANLKPATLRGVESQGMVLAATGEDAIILLCPEKPARPGCLVK